MKCREVCDTHVGTRDTVAQLTRVFNGVCVPGLVAYTTILAVPTKELQQGDSWVQRFLFEGSRIQPNAWVLRTEVKCQNPSVLPKNWPIEIWTSIDK